MSFVMTEILSTQQTAMINVMGQLEGTLVQEEMSILPQLAPLYVETVTKLPMKDVMTLIS